MTRLPMLLLCVLLLPTAALAQSGEAPESEWTTLPDRAPGDVPPPPPPVPLPEPTARQPQRPVGPMTPLEPAPTATPTVSRPRTVLQPNTVSMFGARTLGHLTRCEMVYLGFPLIGLRLALGLGDRFDLAVGYDGFWFMMNEIRVGARVGLAYGQNWALAVAMEAGAAFFNQKAADDLHGARWLTGRRNFNLVPGLVLSYQGDHPRAARLFFDLRYMLTFDTEPYQKDPLGGVPARVQLGHNVLFRAGAEMPLSAKTSFVFLLGLDIHGRPEDSPVMPVCSVGIVTSI